MNLRNRLLLLLAVVVGAPGLTVAADEKAPLGLQLHGNVKMKVEFRHLRLVPPGE